MKRKAFLCVLLMVLCASVALALDDACATPLTPEEAANNWVACEGTGKNRDLAIDNALKRGVSMVYGQIMSAQDKMESSSSESTVTTPLGGVSVEMSHEAMSSEMEKKTAGFVREYKVVSVGPDKSDGYRAHVHARIINPRAGIDAVILLTPPEVDLSLETQLLKIGPSKTISGKEVCQIAEKAIHNVLTGSKHFLIRSINDIKTTAANDMLTKTLVGEGMVPTSELLQAGKMLTCDYVLSTRLEKVAYSQKLGLDKKTKKMGKLRAMKIVISLQLTNVRTGVAAAADTVTLSLDNSEITELLEQDADADLFVETFKTIVPPLRGWIKKNVK